MYGTIGDFLSDLFGTNILFPFPTFGFFVAMAFIVGAYLLGKEIERKQKEGLIPTLYKDELIGKAASAWDLVSSGFVGFLIGHKILGIFTDYAGFAENPQTYLMSLKGNALGGVIAAGYFIYSKYAEKKKQQLEVPKMVKSELTAQEFVSNVTVISAITGLLGAKIFHNLERPDQFLADPIGAILSTSGLTFYGGMLCAAVAVIFYCRKVGVNITHFFDAVAPNLMLSYGIGRIGCQIAGDGDWGLPNEAPKPDWLSWAPDWLWAYDYPNNVLGITLKGYYDSVAEVQYISGFAYPTPLYEVIMAFAIFGILWAIRKKINTPGVLLSIYLIFNGIERFSIEKIRTNSFKEVFGIQVTQAEIISSLLILAGIVGIVLFTKAHNNKLAKA